MTTAGVDDLLFKLQATLGAHEDLLLQIFERLPNRREVRDAYARVVESVGSQVLFSDMTDREIEVHREACARLLAELDSRIKGGRVDASGKAVA